MSIYNKPISFTLLSALTVLVGTIVMVIVPMFMPSTQPSNPLQETYTPLELAGRDVYQAEGCNNCHTQTIRPLKAEVARYGPYSKAWEFEYDKPFLWGSKRTGPDLARIGGKYSDKWHYRHYKAPAKMIPGSNMPDYDFLSENMLNPAQVEAHIKGIGFPYTADQIAEIEGKNEMDALIAYTQKLGIAVPRTPPAKMIKEEAENPFTDAAAIAKGKKQYELHCVGCHGFNLKGDVGADLTDHVWLGDSGSFADWEIFEVIAYGTIEDYSRRAEGGMPPFGEFMGKDKIWSIVAYLRAEFPE